MNRHPPVWPARLEAVSRMRRSGATWSEVAAHFGVSEATIHYVKHRYASELRAIETATPEPKMVVEPVIAFEGGRTIKRFPPMWAEDAGIGRYTVRPRVKAKRID